jgi:ribosome maturation factor RimP
MNPDEKRRALQAVEEAVRSLDCEILRLAIGTDHTVHLMADSLRGTFDMKTCTALNHRVRDAMERAGLPVDDWAIEVESSGTDRPLLNTAHFERFSGRRICVLMRQRTPEDRKRFNGVLRGHEKGELLVELDDIGLVRLPLSHLQEARLDARYS